MVRRSSFSGKIKPDRQRTPPATPNIQEVDSILFPFPIKTNPQNKNMIDFVVPMHPPLPPPDLSCEYPLMQKPTENPLLVAQREYLNEALPSPTSTSKQRVHGSLLLGPCSNDRIFASSLSNPLSRPAYSDQQFAYPPTPTKPRVAKGLPTMRKPSLSLQPKKAAAAHLPPKKKMMMTMQKTKKIVRFSKRIHTRAFKKERTLTDDIKRQMWFSRRDFAEMDQESIKTLEAYDRVRGDLVRLNPDEYCLRGLELKVHPHINRLRRLRAHITVKAVLDTQAYQRRQTRPMITAGGALPLPPSQEDKEEQLSRVSQLYTQKARYRARELGLIDAVDSGAPPPVVRL